MNQQSTLDSTLRRLSVSQARFVILAFPLLLGLGILVGFSVNTPNYAIAAVLALAVPISVWILRRPFNAVILWLIIGPLFVVTYSPAIRVAYWGAHRALIPMAAIVAMMIGVARRRIRFGWVEFSLLAYLLVNLFSVLYNYPNAPLSRLYQVYDWTVVGIALFLLIRMTRPREQELKRLMIALIILTIVQGMVGLMMNFSATRGLLPTAWITTCAERTCGTLGRDAEFSSTLTASMLLIAHYAFNTRNRLFQVLSGIALLLGGVCLVLSFSRSTWLASSVVAVLAIVLYRRMVPYILALVAVVALILSTNLFSGSMAFARERLGYQRTVNSRIVSNYSHLAMIQAKPLLGWGYGNYNRYNLDFVKPLEGVATTDVYISSHNTYLSMAVELGLLGLVLFLLPWFLLLGQSLAVYTRLPKHGFYSRELLVVLWLGVLFWFVVTNFMNMRLAAWGITWVWFLLGLIASVIDNSQEPDGAFKVTRPGSFGEDTSLARV